MWKTLYTSGLVLAAAVLIANCGKKEEAAQTTNLDGYWKHAKEVNAGKTREGAALPLRILNVKGNQVRQYSAGAPDYSAFQNFRIEGNKLISRDAAKGADVSVEFTLAGNTLSVKESATKTDTYNRINEAQAQADVARAQAEAPKAKDMRPKFEPKDLPKIDPKVDPKVAPKVDPKSEPKKKSN